mgnify:FL=1
MKLDKKITESSNIKSKDIDKKSILEILNIFNSEDEIVVKAVKNSLNEIHDIIDLTINSLSNDGRLFYVGAGTSGRLGVLDAAECVPTFSINSELVQGIIAGGEEAMFKSIENAEDKTSEISSIITDKSISSRDMVIGISCSGGAPFVLEFLNQSKQNRASTALITFNDIEDLLYIDHILKVFVGPEIISGSTRMKSGTATKMILNMISTTVMIKLNKTYGNFMVDLKIMNKKLLDRGIYIIQSLTQLDRKEAQSLLNQSNGKVKNAIIMHELDVTYLESEKLLKSSNGSLRDLIEK